MLSAALSFHTAQNHEDGKRSNPDGETALWDSTEKQDQLPRMPQEFPTLPPKPLKALPKPEEDKKFFEQWSF